LRWRTLWKEIQLRGCAIGQAYNRSSQSISSGISEVVPFTVGRDIKRKLGHKAAAGAGC
jgi:hypothetical protein